jgi:thiosulfate/3-mercaptopyruvate sulfurtransferase
MPHDPFVEAAALSRLGPIRFVDTRDQAAFDAGHAPGAVRVPVEAWDKAAKDPTSGFGDAAWWSAAIAPLGLGAGVTAVAYDAGRMTDAARVWFMLQYFGVKAAILNGGWPALAAAGPIPAAASPGSGVRAQPGIGSVGVVDRETLKRQLDSDEAHVFDNRTRAEFTGEDRRNRPRGGHLPGARHISHADLMENGFVHPPGVLRGMLEQVGFQPGHAIVTHCEGGGRAALAAAAAVRAGYDNVRVYYLSFADWARDESCPIVTG